MRFFLLLPCVLLAACQSTPPIAAYVTPQGLPTAQLVVRNDAPGWTARVIAFDDAYSCMAPSELASLSEAKPGVSQQTRSDRPLTLRLERYSTDKAISCIHGLSFQPRESHRYLLQLSVAGMACQASLLDATDADNAVAEESMVMRAFKPMLSGSANCVVRTEAELQQDLQKASQSRIQAFTRLDDFKDILPR